MKFVSWNVNGIRACVQKGFLDFFQETDADIFCIQETKMQEGQLALETTGYHQYWNYAQRKSKRTGGEKACDFLRGFECGAPGD